MTPIMSACSNSSASNEAIYNIVTDLIEKKCGINCIDNYGQTPLMKAIGCGRVAVVQKLLKMDVNIEVRDLQGWTVSNVLFSFDTKYKISLNSYK